MSRYDKYADEILELIADGHSLAAICCRPDMPAQSTVYKWLAEKPDFSERYAHAREIQADMLLDDIVEIADRCPPEAGAIAKAKAQIDARKWLAARLAPKKYGDRVALSGSVQVEIRTMADIFQ